jgi:beta-mannosidase
VSRGEETELRARRVGFRSIRLVRERRDVGFEINGVPVFCRGACWTPIDARAFHASRASYGQALAAARSAGMNMLRVGGTMLYEADDFYDLCDELGILVWHDFMFANMDYPASDPAFVTSVEREARELLGRLSLRPCLALLCGGSEVEQQAAMLGLPRELWSSPLFSELLPAICGANRPDVPYLTSTPTGGALPFQVDEGVAHYYGVGAYLRPLEDARRSEVRFASECLAFANVPDDATIELVVGSGQSPVHHPAWKARVPRDAGVGWDFEDVREHYLERLFEVEARTLRYAEMDRYLALSRVVTGEVMAATFAEWRRPRSTCRGGLVWVLRDLWPGAGFGVIDSTGRPKCAYFYLKRAFAPVACFLSDEGLNGLGVTALNERPVPLDGELTLSLYREGETLIAAGTVKAALAARGSIELSGASFFDAFIDTAYAFRFGPPSHDVAVLRLVDRATGAVLSRAFHLPLGLSPRRRDDIGLEASAEPAEEGVYVVTVKSRAFAQSVRLDVGDDLPDDDAFHLEPGSSRAIVVVRRDQGRPFRGTVQALNGHGPVRISVRS